MKGYPAGRCVRPEFALILVLTLLAVGFAACPLEEALEPFLAETTGGAAGWVESSASHAPISGALVSLPGTPLSGRTDDDGYYLLKPLPAGDRSLEASAAGYLSEERNVSVQPGIIAACDFSLSPSSPSGGERTFYVAPGGSDDNSGTRDHPWANPGFASRQLKAGDTLIILGGRYVLQEYDADILQPPSGSESAWVTIRGEAENRPVLVGRDDLSAAMWLGGARYVSVENLEITHDGRATGEHLRFRDGIQVLDKPSGPLILKNIYIHHLDEMALNIQDVNDLQVVDCRFEYCGFGGIGGPAGAAGGVRNLLVKHCRLAYGGHYYRGGNGADRPYDRPDGLGLEPSAGPLEVVDSTSEHNYGDGLDSKVSNTTIRRCVVANNSCDGVKLWAGRSRVENTLVYGRGDGDATVTPWASIVIGTDKPGQAFEFINCTVDDKLGGNYLMYVQYDEPDIPVDLTLVNTIFCGRGESAHIYLASKVVLHAENNLFYFPRSDDVLELGGTTYTRDNIGALGAGNIYGDPLFVRPAWGAAGDYHLRAGSPAIDRGKTLAAPLTDLEMRVRPQGAGFDIGCYERPAGEAAGKKRAVPD
jgi:hypothetical protein